MENPENNPTPAAAGGHVKGNCPICQSPLSSDGAKISGGEASEHYRELCRRAEAGDAAVNELAELRGDEDPEEEIPPTPEPTPISEKKGFDFVIA